MDDETYHELSKLLRERQVLKVVRRLWNFGLDFNDIRRFVADELPADYPYTLVLRDWNADESDEYQASIEERFLGIIDDEAAFAVSRRHLVEKLKDAGFGQPNMPLPIVSLEDFFLTNDDIASIGCNLPVELHPGPQGFYTVLENIRNRPEVQDVLVEVSDIADDFSWPFSDHVYILSSAPLGNVTAWAATLSPDEVTEGYTFGEWPPTYPALHPGIRIYDVWWD